MMCMQISPLFMTYLKVIATSASLLSLCASSSFAGNAVSSLNGKLGINYGDYDSTNGQSLTGSVAAPLANHFGAQLDGLYSNIGSDDFYGVGGHFFWRDSDRGLIGLAAAGVDSPSFKSYEAGIEAEYYFRYFTPGIYTGYSTLRYNTAAPFIDTERTAPFGSVYIGFYPIADLLIRPSYTRKLNNNYYGVELEYTLRSSNLALTAEIVRGQRDYEQTQFGLRYYFGGKKTLKARHREDDPVNLIPGVMSASRIYQAEYAEKGNAYITHVIQSASQIITDGHTTTFISGSSAVTVNGYYQSSSGGASAQLTSAINSVGNVFDRPSQFNNTPITITGGSLTLDGNTITAGTLVGSFGSQGSLNISGSSLSGATLTGATLNGNILTLTGGSLNLVDNRGTLSLTGGSFISSEPGVFTFSTP